MRKLALLILTVLAVLPAAAQDGSPGSQPDYYVKIPYENVNGKLIVTAMVNGVSQRFILDTGAPVSVSRKLAKQLHTTPVDTFLVSDQSGISDSITSIMLKSVMLNDVSFQNVPALVFDQSAFFDCFEVEGIIGSNMLRSSVVQFSTTDSTIIITNNRSNLQLNERYATKLLFDDQNSPIIQLRLGNSLVPFLFDSGSNELLSLTDEHFDALRQYSFFNVVDSACGSVSAGIFGAAQRSELYRIRIPQLWIANALMENTVAITTSGSHSRMGSRILEHGLLTIDYANERFYFQPHEAVTNLNEKLWPVSLNLSNSGQLVVGTVWDGSITNISSGNLITAVNGIGTQNHSYCSYMLQPVLPKGTLTAFLTVVDSSGTERELAIQKR